MPGDINDPLRKKMLPSGGPDGIAAYPQWGDANQETQASPTMGESIGGLIGNQMGQVPDSNVQDQEVGDQGQALKKRMGNLISPFQGG